MGPHPHDCPLTTRRRRPGAGCAGCTLPARLCARVPLCRTGGCVHPGSVRCAVRFLGWGARRFVVVCGRAPPSPFKRRERVFHTRSVRRSALKRSERSDSNRQTDSRLPGRCTSSRYMYPLDIHLQKSPRSQPRHNPASGFGMFASAPALELSSPGCECAIHISYDRSRTRLWTVLSISSPMVA